MLSNKTDNKQESRPEARWYELPLKDWAIIISALYIIISQSGAMAAYDAKLSGLLTTLTDLNQTNKEIKQQQESINKELGDKINQLSTQLEVMKARIETLEKQK